MNFIEYTPSVQFSKNGYNYVGEHKIYCLKHPLTNEIFYIGRTSKTLKERLNGHLGLSSMDSNTAKVSYIKMLLENRLKPQIELIELISGTCYVDKLKATERELYWIKYFKLQGCNLFNIQGVLTDTKCKEYSDYLDNISNSKTFIEYYRCGSTNDGKLVYDLNRLKADGFVLDTPISEPVGVPESEFVEKTTYDYNIYHDNDENYWEQYC